MTHPSLKNQIDSAWSVISPFWPLKNLIAVNPLQGLEDLPFEEAIARGQDYFESSAHPEINRINKISLKWLQGFFDQGQACFKMPGRENGLYKTFQILAYHDSEIHQNNPIIRSWIKTLPDSSIDAIDLCFNTLKVDVKHKPVLLKRMLTSLSGWAGYIKYLIDWPDPCGSPASPELKYDFLAIRLILLHCLSVNYQRVIMSDSTRNSSKDRVTSLEEHEKSYHASLMKKLLPCFEKLKIKKTASPPQAQFVFCIDVRSEPFRRSLEAQGSYETYGFAGFFGIPMAVKTATHTHASCPVLLKPVHIIHMCDKTTTQNSQRHIRSLFKKLYQGLKYQFITPFSLAEFIGLWIGLWMTLKSYLPRLATGLKNFTIQHVGPDPKLEADISSLSEQDQFSYAEGALRLMGLTQNFAPLVFFCGHGSQTENNAYATALECGACGGHDGSANAQVLAKILNQSSVREYLENKGIEIPQETVFFAGLHNTTTDDVKIYCEQEDLKTNRLLDQVILDLKEAQKMNQRNRTINLIGSNPTTRSLDWSEARPEWGLAKNAAFIVGPRSLTETLNLEGRSFLHSYNWEADSDGEHLTTILTAPMVVAQWINCQYLFSTLNPVAYGGGSKITKNITGKFGIIQGNNSDLMTGLSVQSIFDSDSSPYHIPQRLLTVVLAPHQRITKIIQNQPVLQKLFGNQWVHLICLDPKDWKSYSLEKNMTWAS